MLQVQVTKDANGFGIDLSDVNCVAGLVKGGAAEKADLKVGDILISADGINTGTKRLVQILQRGKSANVFTVVRPSPLRPADKVRQCLRASIHSKRLRSPSIIHIL